MKSNREYYGHSYRMIRLIRYIILVLFVIFTVFALTLYKNDITFENFHYLMKYVEFSPPGSMSGDGNFTFSADSDASYSILGENLAVVSGKKVTSYGMSGKKMLDERLTYQNPKTVENGNYLLVYEFGGHNLSIYNSFSKVFEKKFDSPIDYACLSDDGSFAIISCEQNSAYAGGVMAYDSRFKHIFSFAHPASTVTDLCFDNKEGMLVCATTDVKNGDFLSEILVFDTKSPDENVKSTFFLEGELPLNLFCKKDSFGMMTDKGIRFFDSNCNLISAYDFGHDTPSSVFKFENFIAVTLKSALADTDTNIVFLDYSGNVISKLSYITDVVHVNYGYEKVYVLTSRGLDIYNFDGISPLSVVSEINHDKNYKKVFPLDSMRYILVSQSGSDGGIVSASTPTNTEE